MSVQKNPVVGWRIPAETKHEVALIATKEQRSMGNMLRVLVDEALTARKLKTENDVVFRKLPQYNDTNVSYVVKEGDTGTIEDILNRLDVPAH